MAAVKCKVKLLAAPTNSEWIAGMAAALCYSNTSIDTLENTVQDNDPALLISRVLGMGHTSTIEHVSFTFGIEGVSRALLAQITRHRIASFSVKSQRYNSYKEGFNYIIPPAIIALGDEAIVKFQEQMNTIQEWYNGWQAELGENSNEDARFVLPNACETKMLLTMNARELLHFFELRCCNRAQWEIRILAWKMFELVYPVAPAIFKFAGPRCMHDRCHEGKKTCGMTKETRERYSAIIGV